MGEVATFALNLHASIGLVLAVFAIIGLARGVRRELYTSVAIALAMLLLAMFGSGLVNPVNRGYRMLRFVQQGGLSAQDPISLQEISAQPDLIDTPRGEAQLRGAVFLAIVLVGYLAGERLGAPPVGVGSRLLGVFVGLFNGFGITYVMLPILFPEPQALIVVPTGEVQEVLVRPEFLAQMAVLFIFVMIAFGLYSATGRARRRE